MVNPATASVTVGTCQLQVLSGGHGRPLLVLHDEMGDPGWMRWNDELARTRTLLTVLAPGFGIAPRIDWIRSVRDLACVYARRLRDCGGAPIDVLSFSFGGWLAAEMLGNAPGLLRKLILVAPLGIKPSVGVILDAYELSHRAQLEARVRDVAYTAEFAEIYGGTPTPKQIEAFDDARAETARLGWQPYLHHPSLPQLLEQAGTRVPIKLIWGADDRVVPIAALQDYQRALGPVDCALLPRCGHRPEIEQPERFIQVVSDFLQ